MDIKLGSSVTDTVTGYNGTVTSMAQNLRSADQALVERIHPEGNVLEVWFNIGRLQLTQTAANECMPVGEEEGE